MKMMFRGLCLCFVATAIIGCGGKPANVTDGATESDVEAYHRMLAESDAQMMEGQDAMEIAIKKPATEAPCSGASWFVQYGNQRLRFTVGRRLPFFVWMTYGEVAAPLTLLLPAAFRLRHCSVETCRHSNASHAAGRAAEFRRRQSKRSSVGRYLKPGRVFDSFWCRRQVIDELLLLAADIEFAAGDRPRGTQFLIEAGKSSGFARFRAGSSMQSAIACSGKAL